MGAAGGVTWLILGIYVPMLVVSLAMIARQLYARRGEALDSSPALPAGQRRPAAVSS
jgi:hypothetical protein